MSERPSLCDHADQQPSWLVTLADGGTEISLEVEAADQASARREALEWHPRGRVLAVEKA